MDDNLVNKAIKLTSKGPSDFGRKMGLKPAFVWKMQQSGKVPAEHCRQVEYLTDGDITAEMLLPEVFKPRWYEI